MKKFYAILEGQKTVEGVSVDDKGKKKVDKRKVGASYLYVVEGKTRREALNEVEAEAKKSGRKVSFFGAFG